MKHMPDRYFHFRQLPSKRLKSRKMSVRVTHIFPFSHVLCFFLSILYQISSACRASKHFLFYRFADKYSFSFCFSGKIYLSVIFWKVFSIGHRILSWFFFSVLWRGDWTVSCLLYFWQWMCSGFLSLCLQKVFFSSSVTMKTFPLSLGFQFDYEEPSGFSCTLVLLGLSEFLQSVVACLSVILKSISSITFLSTFLSFWYSGHMCIASYLLNNLFYFFFTIFFKAIFTYVFFWLWLVFFCPRFSLVVVSRGCSLLWSQASHLFLLWNTFF